MSDANATTPRVFIVRHGETEWTISGQCTGNAEILLTKNGEEQVQGTGRMVVGTNKLIDPARLAHIFCSPRKRAVKTLDLLLDGDQGMHRQSLEQAGKITITEDIREWDYGAYEGLRSSEIKERRNQQGKPKWDIWTEGCEGGETPPQVQERLDRLIKQINDIQAPFIRGGAAPDVLVVAHGHILRAFVKRWLKMPMEYGFTQMMEPGAIGIVSYAHHNVEEPALLTGIDFPYAANA